MKGRLSILIDSNEFAGGRSWVFPYHNCSVSSLLKYGCDYAIRGQTGIVGVERKSFSDYIRCIGKDWERFKKQLTKLQRNKYHCVIIEGRFDSSIPIYSSLTHDVVSRRTAEITAHRIPVIFAANAKRASILCVDFFEQALGRIRNGKG